MHFITTMQMTAITILQTLYTCIYSYLLTNHYPKVKVHDHLNSKANKFSYCYPDQKDAYLAATILPKGVNLKLMYAMKNELELAQMAEC